MHLQSAFQPILAAISGAMLGFLGWSAYWNLNVIPDAAWLPIVSLPLTRAIHGIAPGLDIPFLIIIKALPLSVLLGLIAGCLLPRFKFPRVFCYTAFAWPLAYFIFAYYVIWSLDSTQLHYTQVLWRAWHSHLFVAFAVYAWYFVGVYVGTAIAKRRIASQSSQLN